VRARATILALACAACVAPKSSPQAAATPEIAFAETRVPASLAGATVQPAIAYATASRAETLDLFLPQHGTKPYPVVVRIHGGALRAGSPRADSQGPAAERIVAAGYALAVVNYRVAPEAPFPAGARDVKAAVRFLRANAAQWDLDGTRFAAWGAGAGGWFAVMLGVTGDQATVFDDASLGNPVVSSAVQAVVDWYGPTAFARMDAQNVEHPSVACRDTYPRHSQQGTAASTWVCGDRGTSMADPACSAAARASDLIAYIPKARVLPAFTIAHGGDDCEIPWWQSVELVEALKKKEVIATFNKVSRTVHGDPQIEVADTPRALEMLAKVFH